MATLRDKLLPAFDKLRGIPDRFGVRRHQVVLRRRTWSGGKPGIGTATRADTTLTPLPRVRQLSAEEVAASGGTYEEGDYRIDKITPAYTAPTSGGYDPGDLQLKPEAADQDVCLILTGDDGIPFECQLVKSSFDRAFGYSLVARRIKGPVRG